MLTLFKDASSTWEGKGTAFLHTCFDKVNHNRLEQDVNSFCLLAMSLLVRPCHSSYDEEISTLYNPPDKNREFELALFWGGRKGEREIIRPMGSPISPKWQPQIFLAGFMYFPRSQCAQVKGSFPAEHWLPRVFTNITCPPNIDICSYVICQHIIGWPYLSITLYTDTKYCWI